MVLELIRTFFGLMIDLKVFDRLPSLQGCQIINYRSTDDGKWLVLVGIGANKDPAGFKVKGSMQLYSRDRTFTLPTCSPAICGTQGQGTRLTR